MPQVLAASMFDDLIQIYNALSTAVVFCPNHSSYPKPSMLLSLPTGVCKNVDGVVTYLQALHSPNWKDKMQEAEESLQLGGDLQQDQSNVMSTMAGMTTNNQDNALEHNTAHQSCFQGAPVVRYSEHGQNMNHMHPLAQARTLGHAKVTPSTRKPGGASLDSMMRMRTQGLHSRLSTDYESRNSKAVRRTGADWKEKQRIGSTKNTMQQKCGDERLKTGRYCMLNKEDILSQTQKVCAASVHQVSFTGVICLLSHNAGYMHYVYRLHHIVWCME